MMVVTAGSAPPVDRAGSASAAMVQSCSDFVPNGDTMKAVTPHRKASCATVTATAPLAFQPRSRSADHATSATTSLLPMAAQLRRRRVPSTSSCSRCDWATSLSTRCEHYTGSTRPRPASGSLPRPSSTPTRWRWAGLGSTRLPGHEHQPVQVEPGHQARRQHRTQLRRRVRRRPQNPAEHRVMRRGRTRQSRTVQTPTDTSTPPPQAGTDPLAFLPDVAAVGERCGRSGRGYGTPGWGWSGRRNGTWLGGPPSRVPPSGRTRWVSAHASRWMMLERRMWKTACTDSEGDRRRSQDLVPAHALADGEGVRRWPCQPVPSHGAWSS